MSIKQLSFVGILLSLIGIGPAVGQAWAEQNVPVNIQGGGASDLINVTNIPTALDGAVEDTGVRFTCTDSYGRSMHRGEPLFDECMKQKRGSGPPKTAPTAAVPKSVN